MKKELITGCYTPGDYAQEAEERLLKSVRDLGLAHDVREIPSRGSWVLNNSACQLHLQRMDIEMPDTDFLYIDVDGMVRSNPWPYLQTLNCDVAAAFFDGRELLSGTLYLPAGPSRRELLRRWIELNDTHPDVWDQRNLQTLLERDSSIRLVRLPIEFCTIFDLQRRRTPGVVPVIEHFQASRRFKTKAGE